LTLVQIATQSWGVVQDTHGNARSGLTMTLKTLAGDPATIYTTATATATTTSVTNNYGEASGWVEAGTYLRTIDGKTQRVEAVEGFSRALAIAAANPDALIVGAITRNSDGAATSAPVVWPDGTAGTYTATVMSTAFPGSVDAYTITYAGDTTKTYTQPTVTRDSNGAVTNRPAITVS
jgi:hypothetical protein